MACDRLSQVDVFKGIDMWRQLKVPILSVVENMVSSFANGSQSEAAVVHVPVGSVVTVSVASRSGTSH